MATTRLIARMALLAVFVTVASSDRLGLWSETVLADECVTWWWEQQPCSCYTDDGYLGNLDAQHFWNTCTNEDLGYVNYPCDFAGGVCYPPPGGGGGGGGGGGYCLPAGGICGYGEPYQCCQGLQCYNHSEYGNICM